MMPVMSDGVQRHKEVAYGIPVSQNDCLQLLKGTSGVAKSRAAYNKACHSLLEGISSLCAWPQNASQSLQDATTSHMSSGVFKGGLAIRIESNPDCKPMNVEE